MLMRISWWSILSIVVMVACSAPDADRNTEEIQVLEPVPSVAAAPAPLPSLSGPVPANADSLLLAFERLPLGLGHSRDSIFASLGAPESIETQEGDNGNGGRDSLITIRYPHIEFLLRKPLSDGREYFSNVIVADSGMSLPGTVVPHRTALADLITLLGPPHRVHELADTAALTYDVPMGPVLQFYIVGQVVRKVRWVYELG